MSLRQTAQHRLQGQCAVASSLSMAGLPDICHCVHTTQFVNSTSDAVCQPCFMHFQGDKPLSAREREYNHIPICAILAFVRQSNSSAAQAFSGDMRCTRELQPPDVCWVTCSMTACSIAACLMLLVQLLHGRRGLSRRRRGG